MDHFVALNKACHRSSLILNYARVPPKRPQNQQTTPENDSISYTSGTLKGRSQQGTETARVNSLHGTSPCRVAFMLWLGSILIVK